MTEYSIYKDIAERTGGDIYIGVVGIGPHRKVYLYQKIHGISCNPKYRK